MESARKACCSRRAKRTAPASVQPASDGDKVDLKTYTPTEIKIGVQSAKGGYVLINDQFDPDWRVQVNGHDAGLLRANYIMRAVNVPPGQSTGDDELRRALPACRPEPERLRRESFLHRRHDAGRGWGAGPRAVAGLPPSRRGLKKGVQAAPDANLFIFTFHHLRLASIPCGPRPPEH